MDRVTASGLQKSFPVSDDHPDEREKTAASARAYGPVRHAPVDRPRLESDVRYFLKQPSTPWIVFDKEALAASEPPVPSVDEPVSRPEPSGMAVASDLAPPEEPRAPLPSEDVDLDWTPPAPPTRRARVVAVVAACLAVGLGVTFARDLVRTPTTPASALATPAPPAPDKTSEKLDLPAAAPPVVAAVATPAAEPAPPRAKVEPPKSGKKLGRIMLRGKAASGFFFYDGKRLLGSGPRVFDVMCGTHTVALGSRDQARELDIPCGGAIIVTE